MTDRICVLPGTVSGRVKVPASKSLTHRAIIAAALAEGDSAIYGITWSKDIEATAFCMERMGAAIVRDGNDLFIHGIGGRSLSGRVERLFCGESATTLRFLIPIAGVLGLRAVFSGMGRLPERPMQPYFTMMEDKDIPYERESEENLPLSLKGRWPGGNYKVPADISSQFLSGLLMALPMAEEDSVIEVTSQLTSDAYVRLTLEMLERFGIRIEQESWKRYRIPGRQKYHPCKYTVEGDYSQAAFFMAAGAAAGDGDGVFLEGLNPDSHQGDRVILDILKEMQVPLEWSEDGTLCIYPADEIINTEVDCSNCPDLAPVLSLIGAFGSGDMMLQGIGRLKYKESDRPKELLRGLGSMGVAIEETYDGLRVRGEAGGLYEGGTADSAGDHRIAMTLAILALRTFRGIEIEGADAVRKSWPDFWKALEAIGGQFDE